MIKETIQGILEALKDEGRLEAVVYQWPAKANVELDTTAHPVAVLFLIRDGSITLVNGLWRETAEVNVSFLDHQEELDFDGAENDVLLDGMAAVAVEMVSRIVSDGRLEIEGDEVGVHGVYDYDDKNTTGVNLQFRVRERGGHCLLPTEPVPPEPDPDPDPEPEPEEETEP